LEEKETIFREANPETGYSDLVLVTNTYMFLWDLVLMS